MQGRTFSFNTFEITLRLLIELSIQAFTLTIFPMIAVSFDSKMANVNPNAFGQESQPPIQPYLEDKC